jgi:hypothetical protein
VRFVTRAQLTGSELREFRGQLAGLLEIEPGEALARMVNFRAAEEPPAREIDRVNRPSEIR